MLVLRWTGWASSWLIHGLLICVHFINFSNTWKSLLGNVCSSLLVPLCESLHLPILIGGVVPLHDAYYRILCCPWWFVDILEIQETTQSFTFFCRSRIPRIGVSHLRTFVDPTDSSSFWGSMSSVMAFNNSKSATQICTNTLSHERSKHVDINCPFIRWHVKFQFFKLVHVKTWTSMVHSLHRMAVDYNLRMPQHSFLMKIRTRTLVLKCKHSNKQM